MKKFLIIMLSVLLLLSFTSCNKDKSGDVIAAFEKFSNYYSVVKATHAVFSHSDKPFTKDTVALAQVKNLVSVISGDNSAFTVVATDGTTGDMTTDSSKGETTYSATICYDKYDASGVKTDSGEITISGTCVRSSEPVRGDSAGIDTDTYDLTINGVEYKVSYTYNYDTLKYEAASVGGTGVELRLLNAGK